MIGIVLALLAQVALLHPPQDTRPSPRYVVVVSVWSPITVSCLGCKQPEPQWQWESESFASLPEALKSLDRLTVQYAPESRSLVGVYDLERGGQIKVRLKTEKKSRPRIIEAEEWTESSWVVEEDHK